MAAPEFTLFVKPYLEGWANGEEGGTPMTAEILNDNYDAFLLALNEWATSIGLLVDGIPTKTSDLTNDSNFVSDASYVHTDNNYTTTEKNKLSGIEANANNYSLPTASTSTLGGVKVDGITITIANGVISAVGGGGTDVEGNPSGTPTAVLSSIKIGNTIYSIPGGGSGGSSVSFTQILSTGTKIGTITIDGVPTDIYAPTPPTKTSDLTNDSNFVSDANYVHTDNNYTTTEKNKLADLNQVEANPSSGTSAGDLTSISIDGTKYSIPSGGGGGTTVIANPSGSATDELEKIQIGNTIYSVSSGGGGGTGSGKTLVKKTKTYTGDGQRPLVITFDEKPLLVYSIYGPGLNESNTVRMYPFVYGETKASGRYINNDSSSGNIGYTIAYSNNDLTISVTSNPQDAGACLNNNGSSFTITYLVEENTSGGHTILNDNGTSLAQEDNLQFKGVYSHDDSTNEKTIVEVTRLMNRQQYQALSDDEKKGVIVITDENPDPNFVEVVGTLVAGETSVSLSDRAINNNSTFDGPYTTVFGVNPTNMVVTTGDVVLQPLVSQESELIVTVTASSTFSYYPAWKAFSNSDVDGWVAADADTDCSLTIEFPTAQQVDKLEWYCQDPNRDKTVTKIQYSLDGTTWEDCTLSTNDPCDVEISDSVLAKYWKMCFGGPYSQYASPMVSKLELITLGLGTLTLTFPAQQSDVGVKVRVS